VLMWEVFTLAMQPYPARSNIEVLQFVTSTGTLDKPTKCPDSLYVPYYHKNKTFDKLSLLIL